MKPKQGDVNVFSKEFLDSNKSKLRKIDNVYKNFIERQRILTNLRREITDLEEEEELIKKNIARLQNTTVRGHSNSKDLDEEKVMMKWRELIISALDTAKLLEGSGLKQHSSVEDVIGVLEE